MAKTTAEENRTWQEYRREQEQARLEFVGKLMDIVRMWQDCKNRACRRRQRCADPHACGERHKEDILRFQREIVAPWLREQYPTVQWGAPDSVVEVQFEAALAAEEEEKARREGRADAPGGKGSGARRKKKRLERHPLYDPGDV